ncbi:MAG: ATP-binding protein [Flavobacteriales bacterium]|nr:ATP-binding protein [Flavobacteriales bacterium]
MLTIEINSFSYKKGIPTDKSGNGGGFVFDCRGILNPGRYDRYKKLSGKDKDVQEFLLAKTLFPQFIDSVKSIISINVDDYVERGFTNLQISFGCTGGQHRSVFSAETITQFLTKKYGEKVLIKLTHINQENWIK